MDERALPHQKNARQRLCVQFFYGQETPEAVAYHKSQSLDGNLTKIENISPIILHLVTDG